MPKETVFNRRGREIIQPKKYQTTSSDEGAYKKIVLNKNSTLAKRLQKLGETALYAKSNTTNIVMQQHLGKSLLATNALSHKEREGGNGAEGMNERSKKTILATQSENNAECNVLLERNNNFIMQKSALPISEMNRVQENEEENMLFSEHSNALTDNLSEIRINIGPQEHSFNSSDNSQILEVVLRMEQSIKELTAKVDNLTEENRELRKHLCHFPYETEAPQGFPLQTLNDYLDFTTDKTKHSALFSYLRYLGGVNLKGCINTFFKETFSNDLINLFTWTGKTSTPGSNALALQSSVLCRILFKTILECKNIPRPSHIEFCNAMQEGIKVAKQRLRDDRKRGDHERRSRIAYEEEMEALYGEEAQVIET
ncbi:uncharacterized protein [Prorops nasuta]|uniref:uncharacterized protein n=1 Tax=Prorops nasuta TaxID=863751 RepID=UPI0034CE15DD